MNTRVMVAVLLAALSVIPSARAHELPGRAQLVAVNAAIGAAVVLARGLWEGRPLSTVAREVGWGAAGGALGYAGKERAAHVTHSTLAGLEGKLLTSLGTSVLEDAAGGRRPLTTYSTDIGPVFLTWQRAHGWLPQARLLPVATVALAGTLAERDISFDLGSSVRTLTPVFVQPSGFDHGFEGRQAANNLVLGERNGHALGQELVHALQYRQLFAVQLPLWDDTVRTAAWKADFGEAGLAAAEWLGTRRRPADRENLQETEADALEEIVPDARGRHP